MSTPAEVALARVRIEEARRRLSTTLVEVQHRFSPRMLAHEAVEGATETAVALAREGAEAVRARPALIAGVVGVIGVFLARGRIARAFKGDATADDATSLMDERVKHPKKGKHHGHHHSHHH